MSVSYNIDYSRLRPRELLLVVDRSDPQVKALAQCLEAHVTFVERMKDRITLMEVPDVGMSVD